MIVYIYLLAGAILLLFFVSALLPKDMSTLLQRQTDRAMRARRSQERRIYKISQHVLPIIKPIMCSTIRLVRSCPACDPMRCVKIGPTGRFKAKYFERQIDEKTDPSEWLPAEPCGRRLGAHVLFTAGVPLELETSCVNAFMAAFLTRNARKQVRDQGLYKYLWEYIRHIYLPRLLDTKKLVNCIPKIHMSEYLASLISAKRQAILDAIKDRLNLPVNWQQIRFLTKANAFLKKELLCKSLSDSSFARSITSYSAAVRSMLGPMCRELLYQLVPRHLPRYAFPESLYGVDPSVAPIKAPNMCWSTCTDLDTMSALYIEQLAKFFNARVAELDFEKCDANAGNQENINLSIMALIRNFLYRAMLNTTDGLKMLKELENYSASFYQGGKQKLKVTGSGFQTTGSPDTTVTNNVLCAAIVDFVFGQCWPMLPQRLLDKQELEEVIKTQKKWSTPEPVVLSASDDNTIFMEDEGDDVLLGRLSNAKEIFYLLGHPVTIHLCPDKSVEYVSKVFVPIPDLWHPYLLYFQFKMYGKFTPLPGRYLSKMLVCLSNPSSFGATLATWALDVTTMHAPAVSHLPLIAELNEHVRLWAIEQIPDLKPELVTDQYIERMREGFSDAYNEKKQYKATSKWAVPRNRKTDLWFYQRYQTSEREVKQVIKKIKACSLPCVFTSPLTDRIVMRDCPKLNL